MRYISIAAGCLVALLMIILVVAILGVPLSITLTSHDQAPSIGYFVENLKEFAFLAPFVLVMLVPALSFRAWTQYELGYTSRHSYKKKQIVFIGMELIFLYIAIRIFISAVQGNGAMLL